jgi:hypothetical protein
MENGKLGLLYTRSQSPKNLGPTLSIFGLQTGPKLLIKAGTLVPKVANWPPKFDGILFSALGPIQGHNVQHKEHLKSSAPEVTEKYTKEIG